MSFFFLNSRGVLGMTWVCLRDTYEYVLLLEHFQLLSLLLAKRRFQSILEFKKANLAL